MTETMEWENGELNVEYELVSGKTTRGARDSLGGVAGMGPPLEPDETEYGAEIVKVTLFDVDLTHHFKHIGPVDEDDLWEHVEKTFKELAEELK
ncbi:MAG: hypothetical protein IIC69_00010 [Nanoarchaeota archaeon]|nr:hypothetical protein [Nanoarchaeota archaeon]